MTPTTRALATIGALIALTAACANTPATTATGSSTPSTAATAGSAPSSPAAGGSSTTTAAQVAAKVSANDGSAAEIEAALTAAGVPNAAKWTREVMEYRPYEASDTALAKLRKNLEKYKPGDDVMEKILGALRP